LSFATTDTVLMQRRLNLHTYICVVDRTRSTDNRVWSRRAVRQPYRVAGRQRQGN